MYLSRIIYDGCSSYQDANCQGTSLPDSLFNLTQDYYYVVPKDDIIIANEPVDDKVEQNKV